MIPKFALFSFPRSGRGFTRKLVLPPEYGEDNSFTPESPFYQSHDFIGTDERSDRPNLVLARDPLYCFASWFELEVGNGNQVGTEDAFWELVYKTWLPYWKQFARKHILSGRAPVVWYNWVVANPAAYVQFIEKLTGVCPCNPTVTPSKPRELFAFKYYTEATVAGLTAAMGEDYQRTKNLGGAFF